MTETIEIKKHNLINYNDMLLEDMFGAVSFAPPAPLSYNKLHRTPYHVIDKFDENAKPILACIHEVYPFCFNDWFEILDVQLNLNLLHIDQFQQLLQTEDYNNFLKIYDESSIKITMRNICGYGDNAYNIIRDKIKIFEKNPRFHLNKQAALFIYKKIK